VWPPACGPRHGSSWPAPAHRRSYIQRRDADRRSSVNDRARRTTFASFPRRELRLRTWSAAQRTLSRCAGLGDRGCPRGGDIGAVYLATIARSSGFEDGSRSPFEPAVHWIFQAVGLQRAMRHTQNCAPWGARIRRASSRRSPEGLRQPSPWTDIDGKSVLLSQRLTRAV
jgi:hypothetical protein